MNADDDNYDDPRQRPNAYADTGAVTGRVRSSSPVRATREGAAHPINQTGVAENMPLNEPPIPMVFRPAAVAEDQQRPFSNIYAQTLPDTAVVSDFIIEQRGTITTLIKKLRRITITLAILTILLLATMGVLAYGKETFDSMSEHDHQLQLYGQKRHFSFAIIQVGLSLW